MVEFSLTCVFNLQMVNGSYRWSTVPTNLQMVNGSYRWSTVPTNLQMVNGSYIINHLILAA